MNNVNQQPKDFIKVLQIIHSVLVAGVVLFGFVVVFIAKDNLFFSYEEDKPLLFLAIIIAYLGNFASKFVYKKIRNQISGKAALIEKISKFTVAHIFRIALLEAPAFICIFLTMQSNNSFYLILVAILVFIMLTLFPTKSKFENDMNLTSKEKSLLQKL